MLLGQEISLTEGRLESKTDFRHYIRLPFKNPAVFAIVYRHEGLWFEPSASMGQDFNAVSFISLKIVHDIGNGDGTGTASQRFLVYTALITTVFNRVGASILPDKINVYATGKSILICAS